MAQGSTVFYLNSGVYPASIIKQINNSSNNPNPNYSVVLDNYSLITGASIQKITSAPDLYNNVTTSYNLVLLLDNQQVLSPSLTGNAFGKFVTVSITESGSSYYNPSTAILPLSFYTQLQSIPTTTQIYSGVPSGVDQYDNTYCSPNNTLYPTINIKTVNMASIPTLVSFVNFMCLIFFYRP